MKYSASFKLQVVKFASDNSNNSAASRKFGIDEKLVRDWRRKTYTRVRLVHEYIR